MKRDLVDELYKMAYKRISKDTGVDFFEER